MSADDREVVDGVWWASGAATAAAAAPSQDELIEQLQKLGTLRDQGILTDAEFEQVKAKILADL